MELISASGKVKVNSPFAKNFEKVLKRLGKICKIKLNVTGSQISDHVTFYFYAEGLNDRMIEFEKLVEQLISEVL